MHNIYDILYRSLSIYIYIKSGQNYLFIFMPCTNWGRFLSVVRISAKLNYYYNNFVAYSCIYIYNYIYTLW